MAKSYYKFMKICATLRSTWQSIEAKNDRVAMTAKQKGIVFIILSAFLFALMNLFVKMAVGVPPIQKAFFRNAGALIIASVALFKQRRLVSLRFSVLPILFARAFFGTVGIVCNFYALSQLALSDAATLSKLAPFFVVLFSFIFLKEKLKLYHISSIIIAFFASLLIVKPSFAGKSYTTYALIATFGSMGAGAAYTCIRALSQKKVLGSLVVFFFSLISCLLMLPFSLYFWQPMSQVQIIYLIAASVTGAVAQFAVTTAYFHAPAKEISLYDYSQVIFASLMGFFFYHDVPDIYSIFGYVLIFLASLYMFLKKN